MIRPYGEVWRSHMTVVSDRTRLTGLHFFYHLTHTINFASRFLHINPFFTFRWLIVVCLSINSTAGAQSVSALMGTRSAGMGSISTTPVDAFSMQNNIGTLADHRYVSVGTGYEITPSLPGSNRMAAVATLPIGEVSSLGVSFFRFGDAVYSEQIMSIGYGRRMGLASLGAKVNYIQYQAEGFQTISRVSISLGGLAHITPSFSIGAYATNINRPIVSEVNDERLPTILALGVKFIPHKKLILLLEIEKDLQYKPTVKGGVEYKVLKKISIQTGFNINPDAVSAGITYNLWRLRIGYAVRYNLKLILSHQASISYNIKKTKQDR